MTAFFGPYARAHTGSQQSCTLVWTFKESFHEIEKSESNIWYSEFNFVWVSKKTFKFWPFPPHFHPWLFHVSWSFETCALYASFLSFLRQNLYVFYAFYKPSTHYWSLRKVKQKFSFDSVWVVVKALLSSVLQWVTSLCLLYSSVMI